MPVDVDTKDIEAVCAQADRIYRTLYSDADPEFMSWACGWFRAFFDGRYKDYLPIDVPYHDREHTMQGLICLVQLLHGRQTNGIQPSIPRHTFELGMLAVLLHDTGYLKRRSDNQGTGAKYTLTHVDRSKDFTRDFLHEQCFPETDIEAVQNMIQCTAMNAVLPEIPFASQVDRTVGYALATADLLGQMSASDYVDKLPELYAEFTESFEYFGEKARRLHYSSADSLIANTPNFWHHYVVPKLEKDCEGVYRYLNEPYPNGRNDYLTRVEANIAKAAALAGC